MKKSRARLRFTRALNGSAPLGIGPTQKSMQEKKGGIEPAFFYSSLSTLIKLFQLHDPVGQHGVGDFDEAADISAFNVVDCAVSRIAVLQAFGVDVFHDLL